MTKLSDTPRRMRRLTLTRIPLPKVHYEVNTEQTPFESPHLLPMLQEFSEKMADLAQNMRDLSRIHNVISDTFNESFAAFLYGLSITMWCTDFPYMPLKSDWDELVESAQASKRIELVEARLASQRAEERRLQEYAQKLEQRGMHPDPRPRSRQFVSPNPGRIHPTAKKAATPIVRRNVPKARPFRVSKP